MSLVKFFCVSVDTGLASIFLSTEFFFFLCHFLTRKPVQKKYFSLDTSFMINLDAYPEEFGGYRQPTATLIRSMSTSPEHVDVQYQNILNIYSQLSLNGHLCKTDTSLRQTPCVGPSLFSVILLLVTKLLIRWTPL